MDNELFDEEEEEYILDEITGAAKKKTVLSALNKTKLSSREMDEVFLQDEFL